MVACQSESELACLVRSSGDLLAFHPLAFFLSWASCSKYVVDVRVTTYIPGTLQPSLVRSPTSTPLPVIFHLRTHKERSLVYLFYVFCQARPPSRTKPGGKGRSSCSCWCSHNKDQGRGEGSLTSQEDSLAVADRRLDDYKFMKHD